MIIFCQILYSLCENANKLISNSPSLCLFNSCLQSWLLNTDLQISLISVKDLESISLEGFKNCQQFYLIFLKRGHLHFFTSGLLHPSLIDLHIYKYTCQLSVFQASSFHSSSSLCNCHLCGTFCKSVEPVTNSNQHFHDTNTCTHLASKPGNRHRRPEHC
jgi:hypothetical protein